MHTLTRPWELVRNYQGEGGGGGNFEFGFGNEVTHLCTGSEIC